MCMAGRYIENLGVESPEDGSVFYRMNAKKIAKNGYKNR